MGLDHGVTWKAMWEHTLNMTALRNYITMYLDDIDAYGEEDELTEATNVLFDFVMYLKSM